MQEWVYVVLSIALIFDKLDLEVKKEINFTIFDLQKKKKEKKRIKEILLQSLHIFFQVIKTHNLLGFSFLTL